MVSDNVNLRKKVDGGLKLAELGVVVVNERIVAL